MAKFDSKTINFGRVEYTTSTVHVYSSPHDRTALLLPCMRVSFGCQMDRSNYSSPDVQWLDIHLRRIWQLYPCLDAIEVKVLEITTRQLVYEQEIKIWCLSSF